MYHHQNSQYFVYQMDQQLEHAPKCLNYTVHHHVQDERSSGKQLASNISNDYLIIIQKF